MAKSKYAPALFEVIRERKDAQTPDKLAVPKWWKPGKTADASQSDKTDHGEPPAPEGPRLMAAEATEPAPQAGSDTPAAGKVRSTQPPSQPETEPSTKTPGDTDDQRRPLIRLRAGRLVLSLNPVNVTVAVGVLLVAMFTTFELGRKIAPPVAKSGQTGAAANSVEAALKLPPSPEVLNVGSPTVLKAERNAPARTPRKQADQGAEKLDNSAKEQAVPAAVSLENGKRSPGLTYVILERFELDHKNAAEFAQKWLASEHGIQTTLEQAGRRWQLVSVDGFRGNAEPYCEKIKSVGGDLKRELMQAHLPVYKLGSPEARTWK